MECLRKAVSWDQAYQMDDKAKAIPNPEGKTAIAIRGRGTQTSRGAKTKTIIPLLGGSWSLQALAFLLQYHEGGFAGEKQGGGGGRAQVEAIARGIAEIGGWEKGVEKGKGNRDSEQEGCKQRFLRKEAIQAKQAKEEAAEERAIEPVLDSH